MATEQGIVQRIANARAFVRVTRLSACAGCHSESQCRPSEKKELVVEALNDVEARVGDHVRISLPTESLLKVTFLVYFIPIVALIVGAAIGGHLAPSLNMDDTLGSIAFGALAMGVCYLVVRRFDRGAQRDVDYWPRVTQIMPNSHSNFVCDRSDQRHSVSSEQ